MRRDQPASMTAERLGADVRADLVATLELIDTRLRWLSSWTVHNANHLRPKRDGLKGCWPNGTARIST